MARYSVGFTSTRWGMTESQKQQFIAYLTEIVDEAASMNIAVEFHHGQCLGGDEEALLIAKSLHLWTVAHPSNILQWTSQVESDETREPKPPLERDEDIVDESNLLIACPDTVKEVIRSGTWFTIRYARRQGGLVHMIWPW